MVVRKFRLIVLAAVVLAATPAGAADPAWRELEPGLEIGRFDAATRRAAADGDLTVLRIEPRLFGLRLLTAARHDTAGGRDLVRWSEDFGLLAAINAGMYQDDRRTHVGFCQVEGEVVNRFANAYQSAAAFAPHDPADPPFRIFDLDETPLDSVRTRYANVVQNLRLIKRGRENRWQSTTNQWREAALAEDARGRVLFVYCRTPLSMRRFNEVLLDLPLDVVAAQHLEGRSQARFRVTHPAWENGPEAEASGPVLPNVLGVVRRPAPAGNPPSGR